MKKAKLLIVAMLLCFVAIAPAQATYGGPLGTIAPAPPKKQPASRSLTGLVLNQDDAALPHAVVYLKNPRTLTIKTYIANENGSYQFNGLEPNQDYEIFAEANENKSATKTLSAFDNRPKATMNLKIDVKKKWAPVNLCHFGIMNRNLRFRNVIALCTCSAIRAQPRAAVPHNSGQDETF